MKKLTGILSLIAIFLMATSAVSAQYNMGTGLNSTANVDFAKVQARVLKGIDNVIKKLDQIEAKIQASSMPQELKDQDIAVVESIKQEVLGYKTKVEQATTTAELTAATQELKQYLKDSKDELKAVLDQNKVYAAQQIQKKAEELQVKVEQALEVLKLKCKEQADDIAVLEQKLAQLETASKELSTLIKNKASTEEIKAKAKEVQALGKEIAKLAKQIKTECGL